MRNAKLRTNLVKHAKTDKNDEKRKITDIILNLTKLPLTKLMKNAKLRTYLNLTKLLLMELMKNSKLRTYLNLVKQATYY